MTAPELAPGAAGARPRLLARPGVRALLVLYGVVVAFYGVQHLDRQEPVHEVEPARAATIRAATEARLEGAPLLSIGRDAVAAARTVGHPDLPPLTPLTGAGDEGVYLWVPLLGQITGETDPALLLEWLYLGCFGLLAVALPLLFYELFGSIAAGLFAPLLVLGGRFDFLEGSDLHWAHAWAVLAALPLVLLALRAGGRRRRLALAGAALVAGFASSLYADAGLPAAVAAAVAAATGERGATRRVAAAAAVVVAYLAIPLLVLGGVGAARDASLGPQSRFVAIPDTGPSFSESARLGLGWGSGAAAARWKAAGAQDGWLDEARDDPGAAARAYVEKLETLGGGAVSRFGVVLVVVPLLLLLPWARTALRRMLPVVLLVAALAALPPLVGVPASPYDSGWLAAAGMVWLVVVMTVVGGAERLARAWRASGRLPLSLPRGRARHVAAGRLGLAALAAVALSVAAAPLATAARRAQMEFVGIQPTVPLYVLPAGARPLYAWELPGRTPPGTEPAGSPWAEFYADRGGLGMRTVAENNIYQLQTMVVDLEPGRYAAFVDGRVREGGLGLGVLDWVAERWIANAVYWETQMRGEDNRMGTSFTLDRPARVRIVLYNWHPRSESSTWRISSLTLAHLRDSPAR